MPVSVKTGRRRQTSDIKRIQIIYECAQGKSYKEVAQNHNCSISTISRIHTRWKDKGTLEFIPRAGRPHMLNNTDVQRILLISDRNPSATLAQVAALANAGCSVYTIAKRLKENLRFVRSARRKPYLTTERKLKRYNWALSQENVPVEIWRIRIFTDEIHIELGARSQRPKVRRPPGTAYDEQYLAPAFAGIDRTSMMFWGAVCCGVHSPLVAVRKRTEAERTSKADRLGMNFTQYCEEILEAHLLPLIRRVGMIYGPWGDGRTVETIEDGARIHSSAQTNAFHRRHNIHRLAWPPYSPDMNLIENVWAILKRRLRKKWLNPENMPKGREELIVQAQVEWDMLPWNQIYNWFDRMPTRISTLKARRGGATRW